MLSLSRFDHVDLATTRREGTRVLAAYAEEQQFRHVPEVKADAATIRAAVLTDFVPHNVRFVREAPCLKDNKSLGQQSIRHPEIEMRGRVGDACDRQRHDLR